MNLGGTGCWLFAFGIKLIAKKRKTEKTLNCLSIIYLALVNMYFTY
jgi:hypothetical protein